jgi:16S rRNA processing protein RimM
MSAGEPSGGDSAANPEHLIVGQVVAPFGVKGELKVNILTEFPDRFKKLQRVVLAPFSSIAPGLAPTAALNPRTVRNALPSTSPLDPGDASQRPPWKAPKEATPFNIEGSRIHKSQLLLKLEEVDGVDRAEALRGYWVLGPTAEARRLPRGAYYIYQIVGSEMYTEAGALIGTVTDVLTTSANDVYVVKGPGVQDPKGELLVPAIKIVVKKMDIEGHRIVIADPAEWA